MAGAVVTALALTVVILTTAATATVVVLTATVIVAAASEDCLLVLLDKVLCAHPLNDSDVEADGRCKDHEDSCKEEDEGLCVIEESEVGECVDCEEPVDDSEVKVTLSESHESDDHEDSEECDCNGKCCIHSCGGVCEKGDQEESESLSQECLVKADDSAEDSNHGDGECEVGHVVDEIVDEFVLDIEGANCKTECKETNEDESSDGRCKVRFVVVEHLVHLGPSYTL